MFNLFMSTFIVPPNTLAWALTPSSTAKTGTVLALPIPRPADINRVHTIEASDHIAQLPSTDVPPPILTPDNHRLMGQGSAAVLLRGIANAGEIVRPRTGNMLRFSLAEDYARRIRQFLRARFTPLPQCQLKLTWGVRDVTAMQVS